MTTMFMTNEPATAPVDGMDSRIHLIRGQRVMLDSDLAGIYGVVTGALNQAVKRNLARFPSDFAFQLTRDEFSALMSRIVISKKGRGGRRKLPWAFTEHGALLANLVNAICQLLEPPAEEKPRREIVFHMRETAPPHRLTRRR